MPGLEVGNERLAVGTWLVAELECCRVEVIDQDQTFQAALRRWELWLQGWILLDRGLATGNLHNLSAHLAAQAFTGPFADLACLFGFELPSGCGLENCRGKWVA